MQENRIVELLVNIQDNILHMNQDITEIKIEQKEMKKVLDEHTGILKEHSKKLDKHTGILKEHSKKLDEHTKILKEHSKKLDEHTEILKEHSKKLDEHTKILKSNSSDMKNLKFYTDKIAQEVQKHSNCLAG